MPAIATRLFRKSTFIFTVPVLAVYLLLKLVRDQPETASNCGVCFQNSWHFRRKIAMWFLWLVFGIFLQYVATQFTILLNFPHETQIPFQTVAELQALVKEGRFKIATPYRLTYDNLLCPPENLRDSEKMRRWSEACLAMSQF